MAEENVINFNQDPEDGDILKLAREYEFEGEKISELDFSGFDDNVTLEDWTQAIDAMTRDGRVAAIPERDIQFCLYIAAAATHRPHEFFKTLKVFDARQVRDKVSSCFKVPDLEDGDILKLTREYEFEGEKISELDFSGFEDKITTEDMIRASDVLTRAGRMAVTPERDPQYCAHIAEAVTGRPYKFLRTLKITDLKLMRNKVTTFFFVRA